MIRLIASDMDGTLLDSQKRMPPHFDDAVHALCAQGVRFAVASGRQYESLLRDFTQIQDDILFIAENGALVMDRGRRLFVDPVPREHLSAVIDAVRAIPGAHPILCTAEGAFIEDRTPAFMHDALMYYARCEVVPDLLALCGREDVCKIAVFDPGGAEAHSHPQLKAAFPELAVILSGERWSDIMRPGVNKGKAMRAIQRILGISPDACMAFGDYLNDLELMNACTHSYAMANAHPLLKAAARHEAPSNDENGVLRVIARAFDIAV